MGDKKASMLRRSTGPCSVSRTLTPVGNPEIQVFSSLWVSHVGYGIWLYCESTPSTFHFGSFFMSLGFPCGSVGKESTCSVRDLGLIPGLGRFPGEGNRYPLQYSGLENSMNCIVHGVAKIRTWLSDFPLHPFVSSCRRPFPVDFGLAHRCLFCR